MERLEKWVQHFIDEATRLGPNSATGEDYLQISEILQTYGKIQKTVGDYDPNRLQMLVDADRAERCMILPCTVGDDVYINLLGKTLLFSVISISQIASTPTFKAMHGVTLCYIFKADDVGKFVFFTREAAAAASNQSANSGEQRQKPPR